MVNKLYSMRDRKSGMYGAPFASFNHETAKRDFIAFCNQPANIYLRDDMELYYLGEFETTTGELVSIEKKPEFICVYEGGV